MAQKPGGRRRADVQVSILEQFELLPRREDKQSAKLRRAARKAAKREARVERMLAEELGAATTEAAKSPNVIVRSIDKSEFKRKVVSYGTMAVAAGIITSFTLPSYAFSPDVAAQSAITTAMNAGSIDGISTQKFTVGEIVATKYVSTQSHYRTGSVQSIIYRRQIAEYRNWSGPTAKDWIANPKYATMSPDLIMRVAAQYVGTPYVFGGDNPRGFDCSGYVQYVFSQFGISMPHSVIGQDYLVDLGYAVRVKLEDARPGDIVILNDMSHDGIYAGNGQFYHAPRRGDRVKLADIFTPSFHIIRILPR